VRPLTVALMKRLALAFTAASVLALAPAAQAALIHEWQGDGNANDSVGTNNGALVGDTTFTTGVSGQAFSLDGNGDYVSVPDDPSHYFSGSFTVDAWVKTSQADTDQIVVAVYECAMFCPTNMANSVFLLDVLDGQAEGFVRDASGLDSNDGGQEIDAGPPIADGAFHHLVFIRDVEGGRLAMYVDGREVEDDPLDPTAAGALVNEDGEADPLTIGAIITGGTTDPEHLFTGAIDDVRLSDSADYPDTTPPAITPAVTGPAGNAGWYVGDVQAGWTIAAASVVRASSGCDTVPITADTAGTALTCTATTAGGTGSGSTTIKRDGTPPHVTCSTPAPSFAVGAPGKRVSASVTDALSGPASPTASAAADTSSAGHKTVTVTGLDVAGNRASAGCPYDVSPLSNVSVKSLKRCLPSGPFNYRFKVPLKKLVGGKKVNRRSRVTNVRFRIDGKPDGSDRKRPFIASIDVSRLSNGRHVLSADIRLQVPGTKKTFHRRQKFPFGTCA
jgi:hypothetical protein